MTTEKPIYATNVIINPKWGIPSRSSIKPLALFSWGVKFGEEDISLDRLTPLTFDDGCLILQRNDSEFRFSVQARYGPGKIVEQATLWLRDAIFALREGQEEKAKRAISKLRRKDRNDNLLIASKVLFLLLLGLAFGQCFRVFDKYPNLWIVFPVALVVGNIAISRMFRSLNRRIA